MKRAPFAALALALAAPGCLLVTPPSGHMTPLPPVPANAACGEIATVACTGYENCCHDGHTVTMNDCITYLQTSCDARLGAVFRDARTGYSPAIAAEVLEEGRQLVADCDPGIIDWYNARDGLQRAMQGTVANGAMCASMGNDVAAYFSCRDFSYGCIGDNAAGYNCQARRTTGLQCHTDPDCVSGDYCEGTPGSNPLLGFPGQCQPRRANGMPCTTDGACESYLCDTMTTHQCVAVDATNAYCGLH